MKLALATDHAGYDFKEGLQAYLKSKGHDVMDLGTHNKDSVDYPDYAKRCCEAVVQGQAALGILVCGAGIGMSIAANKVHGIRAALCHDLYTGRMAREHNDANILVLPARIIALTYAQEITDIFLSTAFAGGRHQGRVEKIMKMEC
jgi:ribose 5-phosphate isomerase B